MSTGKHALKCIEQQKFANPLAAEIHAYGQPSQKSGRNIRISRQLFGDVCGKLTKIYCMGRQRIVPGDGRAVGSQNKYSRHSPAQVLTGLFLQVAVQWFNAARKRQPIMVVVERLYPVFFPATLRSQKAFTR